MPKGMIAYFIVALHHLIAEQDLVWRTGVILNRQDTRAEVIEYYSKSMITVRITGSDTRGLAAIIDDQLERIHHSFPSLRYDRYLPCNCEVCQKCSEPDVFSLSVLKDFASTGDLIQCHTSHKLVDPASLIRDIFPAVRLPTKKRLDEVEHYDQEGGPAPEKPYKEVFVSYSWTDVSKAIVDQIEKTLTEHGITLIRDKNEMKYKDSIRDFMKRIGRGKAIIVILSKRYLESKNCMFELIEIANRGEIRDRVFPIVLDDATIYEAIERLNFVVYWERKIEELDSKMKKVSGKFLQGIREELDLYDKIRDTIAGVVDILGDMNVLTPDQHKGSNFEELLHTLEARLSE